ncbi:hypothetical protein PPYR_02273 [Photinus pyralis]|uniref:DUF4806 domain-containing protein n=2 Tax=Photinus pyralis TaxID=7054 RepID=A0A5N4B6Y1_PHOPY|nr:uncharacterized protein LOC116160112 [Photinus pyralis]KAB0805303.1 hypothetical protein PPYR_02273 [Photinus pyralis]
MPFKIVQTVEPGRRVPSLSVVPAAWEQGNILYWPNSKKLSFIKTLIEDGDSQPQEGWLVQDCVKKRDNLLSYAAAELEVEEMTRCTDSDVDTLDMPTKRRIKRKEVPQFDYNDLLEKGLQPQQCELPRQPTNKKINVLASVPISNKLQQTHNVTSDDDLHIYPTTSSNEEQQEPMETINHPVPLNEVSYNLFDNESVKSILINQETMLERQEKIIKELAVQRTMLEFLLKNENHEKNSCVNIAQPDEKENSIFPLITPEDVQQFEINLLDVPFKTKVVNSLSGICGTSGKLKGINCCYTLVDKVFKRQLLTKYSWAGGSRDTESKLSFKTLTNVRHLFYEVVLKADHNISELEVETFFKSVIKNAKRRFELISTNKPKRTSHSKDRPVKLNYKKQNFNEQQVEEILEENEEILEENEEILEDNEFGLDGNECNEQNSTS